MNCVSHCISLAEESTELTGILLQHDQAGQNCGGKILKTLECWFTSAKVQLSPLIQSSRTKLHTLIDICLLNIQIIFIKIS